MQSTGDGKYRESLSDDIRELDDLLEEILVASRLETLAGPRETETLDLLALVAEECAHYDEAVLAGVSVRVSGDPRLLRRLVRNLLENARRHGQPPTEVILREEAGKAVLEVVDAGPGVPPPERERVFEPFYQSRGATRGSGLGLALVRRIARLHGGDARVVGVDGGGRFEVTLAMA